jgi:AI-2 transport protein TqsA
MIFDRMEKQPGGRFLLVLACIVVVVAGLRVARPILVPFVLALFLAVVSMPVMFWLRRKGVWAPVALGLTVLVDALVFAAMILLVVGSLADLDEQLPRYLTAFQSILNRWILTLDQRGLPGSEYLNVSLINSAGVFAVLRGTAQYLVQLGSVAFLVGVIMIFILMEATVFPFKFLAILRGTGQGTLRITHIIQEVQAYLWLKFIISLATGVSVTVLCQLTVLDFPVLLGLIAFVLNFVPTIGSIIASIPGVVIALLLHGEVTALVVGLGYLGINTIIGNIMDPQIMGHRLGLSTLVVVLSLLFWGWVWGPVGALLSVPLTMVLKIVLQNVPDLSWIAVLLDKKAPPEVDALGGREASTAATSDAVPR